MTEVRQGPLKGKLADMGIAPGLQLHVAFKAPLGDPIAVALGDYTLTLRKSEAALVVVDNIEGGTI